MAKRIGICPNVDGCSKAQNDERQEVDELDDFVCKECGHKLEEVVPKKSFGEKVKKAMKKPVTWVAIVLLVGAVAAISLIDGCGQTDPASVPDDPGKEQEDTTNTTQDSPKEPQAPKPAGISLSKFGCELFVGDKETLKATVDPEDAKVELVWKSDNPEVVTVEDGVVKAVQPGEAKVDVWIKEDNRLKASCEFTVKEKPAEPYTFSWGRYTGKMKNGVPHGEGNITVTRTIVIDCNTLDGETITLYAGDKINRAEIRNGYLQSGFFRMGAEEQYVDGLNTRLR